MSIQTNVKSGRFAVNSGQALTDLEGYLVKPADAGSELEVLLPTAVSDLCLYVVEDGAAHDSDSEVLPLVDGDQVRIVAKGTGSAGAVLTLAAISGSDIGKVRSIPATAGPHFSVGIAEEDFVDGQHVLVRVYKRTVIVATSVTDATTDGAAAAAADLAALKAETELIGDTLRALLAALETNGQITVA